MLSHIRWKRVLAAAVLSEVGVIAMLLAVIAVYSRVIAPGMSDAEYQRLGERAGYYVAPAAGFVTTILMVLWVGRRLESGFVANWFGSVFSVVSGGIGTILVVLAVAWIWPEVRRFKQLDGSAQKF